MSNLKPIIILVDTQLAENIGLAARAMYNFGLVNLSLVRPKIDWPSEKAEAVSVDSRIDELFWNSVKGNLSTVEDIENWADIVFNEDKIDVEDKEFIKNI